MKKTNIVVIEFTGNKETFNKLIDAIIVEEDGVKYIKNNKIYKVEEINHTLNIIIITPLVNKYTINHLKQFKEHIKSLFQFGFKNINVMHYSKDYKFINITTLINNECLNVSIKLNSRFFKDDLGYLQFARLLINIIKR